jgi:hypothetical protein
MVSLAILALYAIIILVFIILSFFVVFHLANFSVKSSITHVVLFFFIAISSGLLLINVALFFSIDWTYLLSILF